MAGRQGRWRPGFVSEAREELAESEDLLNVIEAVKVLARAHQSLIWNRQRQVNQLRNSLREFYAGTLAAFEHLDSPDAIAILEQAPTPGRGRALSRAKITSALRRAGRERNLETKSPHIHSQLRLPQLEAPTLVAQAYGHSVTASLAVIKQLNRQIAVLEKELAASFETHPDADGARHRYDSLCARGQTHHQTLRAVGNRLVGILQGCMVNRKTYREDIAWHTAGEVAA